MTATDFPESTVAAPSAIWTTTSNPRKKPGAQPERGGRGGSGKNEDRDASAHARWANAITTGTHERRTDPPSEAKSGIESPDLVWADRAMTS